MTYATLEDLIDRAGEVEILQVADRDDDGTADPAVIEAALVHADNLVNGYVAVKYRTPFDAVPDLVRTWAVSIARYWLHRDGAPDYVRTDYTDAVTALKDVAAGRSTIPGADGAIPAGTGGTVMAGHPPAVVPGLLQGWRP